MRLLITGSRGFVGGSLGRFAARAGHEVVGTDLFRECEANWPGKYLAVDVANADLSVIVREWEPDVIFHAAGAASVSGSLSAPLDDLKTGILTWANTLEGVRRSGLKPLVVFPSSAAVYGNPARLPVSEQDAIAPISPYGFHKAAAELLAQEYAHCFGLSIIVCRLFSIFGTDQRRLLVWELFDQLAGPASTIWLHGTGTESRDYLHIDDICEALLQLCDMELDRSGSNRFMVVNVASGEETHVLDLARQVRNVAAPKKEIRCRGSQRPGDPHRWRADISLLRSLLPLWQPAPLAVSLAKTVVFWQKEHNASRDTF